MTTMNETTRLGRHGEVTGSGGGFTLFELLIVIGIIVMVAGLAMPSIISLLTSGGDAQAFNVLSGQLTVARALAIENQTYIAVHSQLGQEGGSSSGKDITTTCFIAITRLEPDTSPPRFKLMEGFTVTPVPGSIAFGEISDNSVAGTSFNLKQGVEGFTSFSVIFSPQGEVVKTVNGETIQFSSKLAGVGQLWSASLANNEEGVVAITQFDYSELMALPDEKQAEYLDATGQLLPINTYTGRLFARDSRGD